jgi:hypothetical protein
MASRITRKLLSHSTSALASVEFCSHLLLCQRQDAIGVGFSGDVLEARYPIGWQADQIERRWLRWLGLTTGCPCIDKSYARVLYRFSTITCSRESLRTKSRSLQLTRVSRKRNDEPGQITR